MHERIRLSSQRSVPSQVPDADRDPTHWNRMSITSIPDLGDPFATLPVPGEEPGVRLTEIPDPPPEENKG
jgi:hypothetical protein